MNSSLLALIAAAVLIVVVLVLKKRSDRPKPPPVTEEVQADAIALAEETVEKQAAVSEEQEAAADTGEKSPVSIDEPVDTPQEMIPETKEEAAGGDPAGESELTAELVEVEAAETVVVEDQAEEIAEPEELQEETEVAAVPEEEVKEQEPEVPYLAADLEESDVDTVVFEIDEEDGSPELQSAEVEPVSSAVNSEPEIVISFDEEPGIPVDEPADTALELLEETEPAAVEPGEETTAADATADEKASAEALTTAQEEVSAAEPEDEAPPVPVRKEEKGEERVGEDAPADVLAEDTPTDTAAVPSTGQDEPEGLTADSGQAAESAVSDEQPDETDPAVSEPERTPDQVHLTLETYSERMYALEERQRALVNEAITRRDDTRRDRLQRELVVMNEKIALLADSYTEEISAYQQVLRVMTQLQSEGAASTDLEEAVRCLRNGDSEKAEAVLLVLSQELQPGAALAAYGCGRLAECRVDLQQALTLYRQAVKQDPDNPDYLRAAGRVARSLYQYKEALPWLENYVKLKKNSSSHDMVGFALAQRELAYTYVLSGSYQKAGPLYKEAMTGIARRLGEDHPEMAVSWQQIGELQETLGEYDKAVALYQKAISILEKKRGTEHPSLANLLTRLAALYVELEREKEAVAMYEQLVRIQEKVLRPTHPQLVISLNNLAEAYRLDGRYVEAEACYQKILAINETVHGPEHPSVAAVLQELAKLSTSQRRPDDARRYQERAAAIFQKVVDDSEKTSKKEELTLEFD
ncbi:MAG: tetratricopeptide repeat protein [Desulfobulbus sp.]|nr:tetratricopeptide repeat protein [Desulfobulbus sp.]